MKPVELRGHDRQITVCKFNFDGDLLFTGGADKKVCLYDTFTQEKIGSYHTSASVKTIDVDVESKYLFVGNFNGHLQVYEVQTGVQLGLLERGWKIKYLEVLVGNKDLLVCYEKMGQEKVCEVCVFNIEFLLKTFKSRGKDEKVQFEEVKYERMFRIEKHLSRISYGYLNKYIIATSSDGKIIRYDPEGNVTHEAVANDGECKGFSFAKDFSLVATCGQDGVKFFDPENLKLVRVFKTEVPMNTVAISPLLSNNGKKLYHFLMAGGIPAREAAMSKKGGFEIHICNVMYEKEIGTLAGSFSPINSIEYTPDGKGFVCGAEEGVSKYIKFDPKYFEIE